MKLRLTDTEVDYGIDHHEMHLLSTYNGEVARGLVHTREWDIRMRELQDRYNEAWSRRR